MQTSTRFGPYEIIEEIGHGGMGIVYRAHDTRLNRDVALKVVAENYLASGTPNAASHERFFREARASSALNHPNICTIYDVGEQGGRPYLVMELLEGQTLKRLINGHPLAVDQVLDYSIQLASALVEAHSRGILHRDIKPANLFIVRRGQGTGTLKVLDFGLAKRSPISTDTSATNSLGDFTALEHSLTKPGSAMGTVAYMAPEQARGEELDARADIFAAGVVMYEMATGSPPFHGQSIAEIFAALLAHNPDPIRKRVPQFPRELDQIVLKALAKDKNKRYASASELVTDLEHARFELLGQTSPTGSSSAAFVIARRRRKARRFLLVSAVVLLAGAVAVWFAMRPRSVKPPAPVAQVDSIIVSEFANHTGDPVFDSTLKQALTGWLQQSPSLNVVSESHLRGSLAYMNKPSDQPVTPEIAREIAEREGDKAIINGTISGIGNQYLITLEAQNAATGDVITHTQAEAVGKDQVLNALHTASDALRKNLGESLANIQKLDVPRSEATTPSLQAFRAYAMAQSQANQANFAQSIGFYKHAIELDPNFAMAYAGLGVAYLALGNETLGNQAITHAFQLSDKVSERERLYIRAHYYMNVTGDLPQAIDLLKLYRDTYPNDAAVPTQLSVAYLTLGRFEQAYDEAKRTLEMNPRSGSARGNAMLALTALARYQDAKKIFDDAKTLNLADDASIRGLYIYTAYLMGDETGVQQQVEWSRGQPDGFILNSQLAIIHENEGRFADAANDWRQAVARMTDQKLVNSTATLITQETLDRALVGNCDDALPRLDRSLKLDQERTMQGTAAIAFALCGQPARAMAIRQSLAKQYPEDTIISHVFLPDIDAAISLREGHSQDALTALAPTVDYDILGISAYLRGMAHLAAKEGAAAASDFSFPATHRSAFVLCQVQGMNVAYPLSLLGLARAETLLGDTAKAREQYQAFFNYWEKADSGLAPLKEAHAEAARLGI